MEGESEMEDDLAPELENPAVVVASPALAATGRVLQEALSPDVKHPEVVAADPALPLPGGGPQKV
jgi:hypothetical protein